MFLRKTWKGLGSAGFPGRSRRLLGQEPLKLERTVLLFDALSNIELPMTTA